MAEITYYADARLTEVTLTPDHPGQISHDIPSTGIIKTLNQGYGRWEGVARFGVMKGEEAAAMEAMLASLDGSANYVELPIHRPTTEADTTIASVSGEEFTLTTDPKGLVPGAYVRSGNRLFVVRTVVDATRTITLWPFVPLEASDPIEVATTVRARSTRRPDFPSTPHWSGPWVLSWVEAI